MSAYTIGAIVNRPYQEALPAVRAALQEQGFGVLTEIDLQATFRAKLDVTISPQVILGACRPPLAYEALQTDPSIAAVLPCNVVVRALDDATTMVEAFDPDAMMGLSDDGALEAVAADARQRLTAVLEALTEET